MSSAPLGEAEDEAQAQARKAEADAQEAPLDPSLEKLRGKMTRLLIVSVGIMSVGIAAVFAALVYKIGEDGDSPLAPGEIRIPQGARIISASLEDERILLHLRLESGKELLLVHDYRQDRLIARIAVE